MKIVRLEQIKDIERHLNHYGFEITVPRLQQSKEGFFIHKGIERPLEDYDKWETLSDQIHARTQDLDTGAFGNNNPLVLNLKLKKIPYEDPENLDYMQGSLNLKRILDEHNIPYHIHNLDTTISSLSKYSEKLERMISRLRCS